MCVKGILLAGGSGTRLWPITKSMSKGLMPVYDKPVVYYPITTLMLAGIREILVISTPEHIHNYRELLGNGSEWGITFEYAVQPEPKGIPEALLIGENFVGKEKFALILGDNLLYGLGLGRNLLSSVSETGATILAYEVSNPEEYGVILFDENQNPKELIEKPKNSLSRWAIPGLYFFDFNAVSIAKNLKVSQRGELEIVDLLNQYLRDEALNVIRLTRGTAWLDLGNANSLSEAADFVRAMQVRQGLLIGSPEEIAWRMGWIASPVTTSVISSKSSYAKSLIALEKSEDGII
jgi:glucose-1-phosphate thymidylyltransferase